MFRVKIMRMRRARQMLSTTCLQVFQQEFPRLIMLSSCLFARSRSSSSSLGGLYAELKKVNPTKSRGPDMIPAKIIKEFAYELSVPLTNILNSSFAEGKVPTQWKNGIVVLIPKQSPPSLDKLRPASLTSIFAKTAEGFVSRSVIDDLHHVIDHMQFGIARCVYKSLSDKLGALSSSWC